MLISYINIYSFLMSESPSYDSEIYRLLDTK